LGKKGILGIEWPRVVTSAETRVSHAEVGIRGETSAAELALARGRIRRG
jgi:hypothetical protein